MSAKLRIKIGQIEIDCEATEDFLKAEVPVLLKAAMELAQVAPSPPAGGDGRPNPLGGQSLSTSSIAAKLDVKTGPELLVAAAAQLTFIGKKETFSRDELLAAMKSATSYYQKNYSSNLSKMLAKAISDQVLSETAKNTYAVAAGTRTTLGAQLANG